MTHIYETIILGGGPAGLSAALYAGRGKLDTLLIEKGSFGGQVATTYEVDNYPGTDIGITGPQLADKMRKQAETFGTKFVKEDIVNVELQDKIKKITTTKGEYLGKTVIIATGASPKMVGFKGEADLRGRGVSYCATCDADFFTDLPIAVIGGGDSAIQEALYLAKFGSKVTIIHRRQGFRAAQYLVDRAKAHEKIDFLLDSVVEEAVETEGLLTGLKIRNVVTGEVTDFPVDGVFVFVGYEPISDLFVGKVKMNDFKEIITDVYMRTDVPGVFAAGDVRETTIRQVVTAAADGAVAAISCEKYLGEEA
ncbi:thioredoxin-disulfide reductase [Proteiniclasticum sp. BAD-10]|uniref:Thioredoxin reductase n=1 Tax=Proteiniclasticum sediminis TaxID=2804028 RepID=A0A941CP33_9CLOT|nr:thioredoxin-disulfide reductase [Proteiniclasticum sediminis]MBR0576150.1 thioredoxin-disulfide reductase [Proteiniclasticum sediminis]